jgi:DNA-binding transcriptional regulator PaaX
LIWHRLSKYEVEQDGDQGLKRMRAGTRLIYTCPPTSKTNDWQLTMLAQDNSREEQVDDDDYDDDTRQE